MVRSDIAFKIPNLHIEFNITYISIFWKGGENKCVLAYSFKNVWILRRWSSESMLFFFSQKELEVSMLLLLLAYEDASVSYVLCVSESCNVITAECTVHHFKR